MIDITIKTLDSRNHNFSVEDNLTVKQLKEQIAESVDVPVESQRLIYCGRVLVDEKKLSEYDVNGKVIHLVQRAPPSSSGESGSSTSEPRSRSPRGPPFRGFITPGRVDGASGNAMYLGAMAFPADLMDAQGISMPQPRHRLSQSRLAVARAMLRRARYTLLSLENPTQLLDAPFDPTSLLSRVTGQNRMQSEQTAANAASTASGASAPPSDPPTDAPTQSEPVTTDTTTSQQLSSSVSLEAGTGEGEMAADEAEPGLTTPPDEPSPVSEEPPQNGSGEQNEMRNGRYRFPGPTHMAEVITGIREIERRLSPFMDSFHELVRTDPVLEHSGASQRLFDQVSKIMHYLAHAYHAVSDIMCDFSAPPPRRLRCRPVLIQHSAVLQTGIPIQAGLGGGRGSSGGSSQSSNNNNSSTRSDNSSTRSDNSSTSSSTAQTEQRSAPDGASAPPDPLAGSPRSSPPAGGPRGGIPGNLQFFMDVGQGSITIDSVEATLVTNPGNQSGGAIISASGLNPPDFLHNLMQAIAGQMTGDPRLGGGGGGGGGGGQNSQNSQSSQSSPGGGGEASSQGVTNSQARGNVTTQPTTSTQTRSTTRPHVHFAPTVQGMTVPGFFDPFLPCNSHHIHNNRRRFEEEPVSTNNNNVSTSTAPPGFHHQASHNHPVSARGELPPPELPNINNVLSNFLAGNRGNGSQAGGGPPPAMIRILPRDVTVFLQGSPSVQNMSGAVPIQTSVAELFTNLIQRNLFREAPPLSEGSNVFANFFFTITRNLRIVDVVSMGSAHSTVMMSLRPVMRDFIRNNLLAGREGIEAVIEGINRINSDLRPLLTEIMTQENIPLRDDIDLIATINQLNHNTFPVLMRDVLEGEDSQYLRNIPARCTEYVRNILSILLHCCRNGEQGMDAIYAILARRMISGVQMTLQNLSTMSIVSQLQGLARGLQPSPESIQSFLVYRMGGGAHSDSESQAMETEMASEGPLSPPPPLLPPSPTAASPPPPSDTLPEAIVEDVHPVPSSEPDQPLPDVITGAEQWHNGVPPDWVPIMSRDGERQRRQAAQGPLSDAYLSGMPSKRRKLVTSAKPHTTSLATVITESMTTALDEAGVCPEPGLAETAGCDSSLRSAYREQVRSTIGPTLRQHPDFNPDKYPAAAKLFTPK